MRLLIGSIAAMLVLGGCASKKFVRGELEQSEVRTQEQIEELKSMIEDTQSEIRDMAEEFDVKLDPIEEATNENALVLKRMGELRFQTTLSDTGTYFKTDSAELTEEAKTELSNFAKLLIAQNRLVQIEIQGHTDSRGSEVYNKKLGEQRALSVRDYLYSQFDIPLHLMSVISFGSEKPVADNGSREGRAQNRRVVLVVRVKI